METIPVVLTILFTFLSPFVTAYFNRVQWSAETKTLTAIVVSAVIAVLYLLMTGGIGDWSQLAVVVPAIFGLQQAIFRYFVTGPVKELEIATTSKDSIAAFVAENPESPLAPLAPAPVPDATPIYTDTPAKG